MQTASQVLGQQSVTLTATLYRHIVSALLRSIGARSARLVVVLGLASAAHAFDSVDDDRTWAVTGLSIIDVETGAVRDGQTIVVRHGVIQAMGPGDEVQLPDGALVVDEPGRYAIPGLWDMHVHLRGGPALEAENERWLEQYLGFGITTVRDAGGDLPDAVLRWKDAVLRGEIEGPRIFTSLQKIDGPLGAWSGSIPVEHADDVGPALDGLEAAGADFVKIYDGSITPKLYLETLAETERRELRTAAHVPLTVPFDDAIDAGLDSVEHAFHLLKAAHPRDRAVSRRFAREGIPIEFEPFFVAVSDLGRAADEAHARQVFQRMLELGTALTPTIYIRHVWNRVGSGASDRNDPRLQAVPPGIRETFAPGLDVLANRTPEERASDRRLERLSLRLTSLAAEQGVAILAGSDTGASNPLAYPGDSLHHELAILVEAGLTPLRALQAATVEPARWFDAADRFGTIDKGKQADFLILDANPLADIENTRALVAVVQQGVFFERAELERLKELPRPEE